MTQSLASPFPIFTDIDGDPLESGYLYVGTAGLNAETNPISVFWDRALTVPAAQPVRTLNGYPSRNGTPAVMYIEESDASLIVKNKNGSLVFSSLNLTTLLDSGSISFVQAGTGAAPTDVQSKLREVVSVKDFGATGDGVTDDTAAFQAAVNHVESTNCNALFVPMSQGERYNLVSKVNILRGDFALFGDGGNVNEQTNSGYIFSTTAGGVLFDYGNGTVMTTTAFTIKGIAFYGNVTTPTQTCFDFTYNNPVGPMRAIVVRDCSFIGFENAFRFDNAGNNLSAGFLDIQDCNFRKGVYAILANVFVYGLRFVANQAEVGASIKGEISVYCDIRDNLLESNENCINLAAAEGCSVTIRDNYFEDMYGDYIAAIGGYSAQPSSIYRLGSYYKGGGGRTATVDGYLLRGQGNVVLENWGNTGQMPARLTLAPSAELLQLSKGLEHGYQVQSGDCSSTLLAKDFIGQYIPCTASLNFGSTTALTPHGHSATCGLITAANGASSYLTANTVGVTGDLIVVSFLVRFKDRAAVTGWANSLIEIYNHNQTVLLGTVACDATYERTNDWYLMTCASFARGNFPSGTTARIIPYSGASAPGAGCFIAGAASTVISAATTPKICRPMYPLQDAVAAGNFSTVNAVSAVIGGNTLSSGPRATVAAVATTLATTSAVSGLPAGNLSIVTGTRDDGANFTFTDIVLWVSGGPAPVVISSQRSANVPAARTYSLSGDNLQVAMAADTYLVSAHTSKGGY